MQVVSICKCLQNILWLFPKFGSQKHKILGQFFRDFRTRHRISPERNVASTTKMLVSICNVSLKFIYFPWPLTQKRLRSVCLLWSTLRRPLRCNHQSCDMSSYSYLFFYFVNIGKRLAMGSQPNLASRSEAVACYKCPQKFRGLSSQIWVAKTLNSGPFFLQLQHSTPYIFEKKRRIDKQKC